MKIFNFDLQKKTEAIWEIKKSSSAEAIFIFAKKSLIKKMEEEVFFQAKNVAELPGLVGPVCLMPDAHSGYGAPIGTVFAMDENDGYISPGAIGYDINCGMRLIKTNLFYDQLKSWIRPLINNLFEAVPAGLGRRGFLKIKENDLKKIIEGGVAKLSTGKNFVWENDINHIENNGWIEGADFSAIFKEAKERGINQLATLGSGNHYLEIQKVEKIIDKPLAKKLGIIAENQIMVMIHCGSRGLGHQVCTDYLRLFEKKMTNFDYRPKDRQLACLPIKTPEAKSYLSAMAGAANFAFVNRQLITYQVRQVFSQVLGKKAEELEMDLVYDVAHNIGKFENHKIPESQKEGRFFIHRKGATRSFPQQPVIIGGSMETGSYLLFGTDEALLKSYGSTAHGSGRTMSRAKAKKEIRGEKLWQEMNQKGIYVKSASFAGLAEEAGIAYKNISDVVKSINLSGLSKSVAYFKPLGNIKG